MEIPIFFLDHTHYTYLARGLKLNRTIRRENSIKEGAKKALQPSYKVQSNVQ